MYIWDIDRLLNSSEPLTEPIIVEHFDNQYIGHLTSLHNSSLLVGVVGDFRTNEVVFWNIDDDLTELYRLDTSRVDDLSFSEDGRLMAISRNGYIELWGVTE